MLRVSGLIGARFLLPRFGSLRGDRGFHDIYKEGLKFSQDRNSLSGK
jgi:hypothetical protein